MEYRNLYEVRFETKKCGLQSWVINIEAYNAKQARERAEELWNEDIIYYNMHQFHIRVKRLADTEEFKYHYFHRI